MIFQHAGPKYRANKAIRCHPLRRLAWVSATKSEGFLWHETVTDTTQLHDRRRIFWYRNYWICDISVCDRLWKNAISANLPNQFEGQKCASQIDRQRRFCSFFRAVPEVRSGGKPSQLRGKFTGKLHCFGATNTWACGKPSQKGQQKLCASDPGNRSQNDILHLAMLCY